MSTTKIAVLVGLCLLLGGCVPASSIKGIAAIVIPVIAAVGAWFGFIRQNHEHEVCQKARDLDKAIKIHEETYHKPTPGAVASLDDVRKTKSAGVVQRSVEVVGTVSRLNQRV